MVLLPASVPGPPGSATFAMPFHAHELRISAAADNAPTRRTTRDALIASLLPRPAAAGRPAPPVRARREPAPPGHWHRADHPESPRAPGRAADPAAGTTAAATGCAHRT